MKTISKNEYTAILVLDEPGEGGACHRYEICPTEEERFAQCFGDVRFQKGPIQSQGINGCTIEDLLAICIHRLEGFQSGGFPCEENEQAIFDIISAKSWLNKRTKDRKERGVEGEKQK